MGNRPGNPKTGGRKKGTPNKSKAEIREHISNIVSSNLEIVERDLRELKPEQRVKLIIELARFVIPQMKAVDLKSDIQPAFIQLNLGEGTNPEDE